MVFFTCNHCGDSIKKPSVEKHYMRKCQGASVFVSCMDCLKDFRGEEFVSHTKCITEAEKYSGKDFIPKQSKNAGQKKQENWLVIVRSVLASSEYKLSPDIRSIIQKMQNFENIPRKKAKFQNFISNCMRCKTSQAAFVWEILEKASQEFNNTKESKNDGEAKTQLKDNQKNNFPECKDEETIYSNGAKNVQSLDCNVNGEQNSVKNIDTEALCRKPKHKKSKKRELANSDALNNSQQKHKCKKLKAEECISDVNISEKMDTIENECVKLDEVCENLDTSKPKFDWKLNMCKIVAKRSDGISLEKLKKKVCKRYDNFCNMADTSKSDKLFHKHFKKSGLVLDNDIVKISN